MSFTMRPIRAAAVLATVLLASFPATAARKPNVLYVFSDMQRAYSMGCYGDKNARTPQLDRFATEGLRLDCAISPTPVCCPHRASLMSGQYAHHNGMMSNGSRFTPPVKCLAETFREAGYVTGSGSDQSRPPDGRRLIESTIRQQQTQRTLSNRVQACCLDPADNEPQSPQAALRNSSWPGNPTAAAALIWK
jgi:hypothetical protein